MNWLYIALQYLIISLENTGKNLQNLDNVWKKI